MYEVIYYKKIKYIYLHKYVCYLSKIFIIQIILIRVFTKYSIRPSNIDKRTNKFVSYFNKFYVLAK